MKTIKYSVPNISCAHCVHTIKMEVSELQGVQNVDGDIDGQEVTVTFLDPATEDQIIALMTEINYAPVIV
jgi:copper chaperone CopZ